MLSLVLSSSLRRVGISAEVTLVLSHLYFFVFLGQTEGEALLLNILSECDLFRLYFRALAVVRLLIVAEK